MSLGVNVSKIIQASLGSTTQTLDRPTATGPKPTSRSKAIISQMKKPVRKPAPKHVEITIKLLVPH